MRTEEQKPDNINSKRKPQQLLNQLLSQNTNQIPAATPVEKMSRKLKSSEGKGIYKKRKQTVELVFEIIKEILGFSRFSLRGKEETDAE